jgi:hypothetical protein
MWMILKLFGIWFCRLRASLFIFTGGYSSCRRCHTTHAVNAEGKVVFSEEHTTMVRKNMIDLVESLDNWEAASTKREKKLISNASG